MNIRFNNATVSFDDKIALHPIDLTLSERRIGIIGLNGSGKTTFARLINGLTKPTSGTVTTQNLDTVEQTIGVRQKVGYVFQNPHNQIILPIVKDDIALGLKRQKLSKEQSEATVLAVLERFGITHLADQRSHELSGGELQLVALAALIVTGPEILIMDEPTNQLDLKNRALIATTMQQLEQSIVVITHDLDLLGNFDRVILFHQGRVYADGLPPDVIATYRALALQ